MDACPDSPKSAAQAESNVLPLSVTPTSRDPYIWEHVHSDYRTGLTYSHLSEKYGIPISTIFDRRKAEGWCRDVEKDVQIEVAKRLVVGETDEIRLGEVSDDQLIDLAATAAVKRARKHRVVLADAIEAMAVVARRLRAAVEEADLRKDDVPVLGVGSLSLADAVEIGARLGMGLDRLIKLDRTAHGLDEREEEKPYEDRLRDWHSVAEAQASGERRRASGG